MNIGVVFFRTLLVTILLAELLTASRNLWAGEPVRFRRTEQHMGTYFTLTIYARDEQLAEKAFDAAFGRIRELDNCLSNYKTDSEVNRLSSASPHPQPVPVSMHVWRVLQRADHFSRLSDGAFDVTVGPVTKLWRRARRQHEMPAPDRLQPARDSVGYQHLVFSSPPPSIRMMRPGMLLDLGGIAKGYALDVALQALQENEVTCALLDGGGDLLAGEPPPREVGWKVGVAGVQGTPEEMGSMKLARRAVATSGDLYQFVEIDGVRYSHLVDPRTGLGLTHRGSVSVIATAATAADALASAVSVMGPSRGVQLIESLPDAEVQVLAMEKEEVRVFRSTGFPAMEATARSGSE